MSAAGTPRIVAHCRAGFEAEAAEDLRRAAAAVETSVEVDAPVGRGFVVATPRTFDSQRWPRALLEAPPVFVRALFFGTGPHSLFDAARRRGSPDRVAPLVELARGASRRLSVARALRTRRADSSCSERCISKRPTPTTARSCRASARRSRSPWPSACATKVPSLPMAPRIAGAARALRRRGAGLRRRKPRAMGQPLADGDPAAAHARGSAIALDLEARGGDPRVSRRTRARAPSCRNARGRSRRRARRLDVAARSSGPAASPRSTMDRSRETSPTIRSSPTCASMA